MGLISRGLFVVAVAAMAFASFLIVSGGANHRAEAQTPADGAFTIAKVCVPNVSATFDFEVTVEIDGVEADELSGSIDIACGEAATFPTDGLVSELDGVEADTPVSITVGEGTTDVPVETIEFQGDCTINTTAEAFLDDLEADGFLCTITNTIDLATLRVEKACPAGSGGLPSFTILVDGPTTQILQVACGGPLVSAKLLPGNYSVTEFANGFDIDIACDTGSSVVRNTTPQDPDVQLTIDYDDVFCTITNTLTEDDDGTPLINNTNNNIINVNSTNTNDNANNNNNANENANNNANENNNANTNTQNQTNDQDQTNNNTQTTDVNASPVVNISGAGALSGGGGGGTTVRAPSTGDGGLLGLQRQEAGYVTWVAAAGVLLLLAAARARDLWSEK